jgi:hypothetical protein
MGETTQPTGPTAFFFEARRSYHAALLKGALCTDAEGIPSIADRASKSSIRIAQEIMTRVGSGSVASRLAGQMSGNEFEDVTWHFLTETFLKLKHLRPGRWEVLRVTARGRGALSAYEQYSHLADVKEAVSILAKTHPRLAASIGGDYTVSPDVVLIRHPEPDEVINADASLVDESVARMTMLRQRNMLRPVLHASISCKWTLRSDRAQNARTEALNLTRHRKGHLPHIVVATGEPLPTRLASLAMGTGDVDCVYHFALTELVQSLNVLDMEDQKELLDSMVAGKRLKDISDLPLDLAV